MGRPWRAATLVSIVVLSGCAAHRPPEGLARRFVTQGTPAFDAGGPRVVAPKESLHEYVAKIRRLAAEARPRHASFGDTIEARDPRLGAALLAEVIAPTPERHVAAANEYLRLGVRDAAYTRLSRAAQQNPRFAPAYEGMARIWRDWGLPGLALADAHRAVFFAPESASAENTLGTVLDALGQTDEARRAYERALMLDTDAGFALNNLCFLAFRQGRFDEAEARCEAAIRISPSLAAARNNLALVYAATGRLADAHAAFASAGGAAAADYNLGIMHLAGGDLHAAAVAFQDAIQARPGFTAAKARAHATLMRLVTTGSDHHDDHPD